jgi:MipA family protein
MIKKLTLGFMIALLCFLIANSADADTAADLGEDLIAAGVPGREKISPAGLHGFLGVGVFAYEKIVGDSGRRVFPLPVVIATYNERVYVSLGSVGVWLIQSDDRTARFGAGVKGRMGWNPDDDSLLAGMSGRDNSLDGYFQALFKTPVVNISSALYHDIGHVSEGSAATLRLSHNFWFERTFRLTPSIGTEWQSEKLVGYYYGVRPSEARAGRPAYQGRETVNVSAGLTGLFRVNRSWSLLGGFYATNLGSGIEDSPIVKKNMTTLGFFGVGMVF